MRTHNDNFRVQLFGDFRVVGVLVSPICEDNIIGYLLYAEKKKIIQPVNHTIAVQMMERYKFTNSKMEDGKFICTDCDLKDLPRYKFESTLRPLDSNKIYIVGTMIKESEVIGYRIITGTSKVLDLNKSDLFEYISSGKKVINAVIEDSEIKINEFK